MSIFYNLDMLNKRLEDIKNEVTGRSVRYRPMIVDDTGKFDSVKLDGMIEGMIESLGKGSRAWTGQALPDDEKELYRCFLYCCMFGPGPDSFEDWCGDCFTPAETFRDIIRMAEDPCLKLETENELERLRKESEVDGEKIDFIMTQPSFFRIMDDACAWLENGIPKDPPNPDDYTWDNFDDREMEYRKWYRYMTFDKPSSLRWYESVPDKKRLKKAYKDFEKLYFKVDHMDIAEKVRNMVDEYLYSREISPLALGDAYGLVDDSLKKALGRVRYSIERARAYHDHQ